MADNCFTTFEKKHIIYLEKYITEKFPNKRKHKYSNYYYLCNIYYILKTGIQWNMLNCECHYTSIYKKYTEWVKLQVFKNIYNILLEEYLSKNIIKNTYIDSSHIKNVSGSDSIGRNHYDRFRNSTKIHLIIDDNRIPINYAFTGGNVNDSKMTESLSKKLIKINKKDNRRIINLVGDKGYVNYKLQEKLQKEKINLYTPLKKNNKKIKNKYAYMKKYNKFNRISIENMFCRLDKFKRIQLRYEKKIINLEGFHLLAFIQIIYNYNHK
jgi:hypothetical protein